MEDVANLAAIAAEETKAFLGLISKRLIRFF